MLATSDFGEMDSMDFTPDSIGFYRILWFSSPDSIIFWILLVFIGFYWILFQRLAGHKSQQEARIWTLASHTPTS